MSPSWTPAPGLDDDLCRKRAGDVLIAWENEALYTMREYPGSYEVVVPVSAS